MLLTKIKHSKKLLAGITVAGVLILGGAGALAFTTASFGTFTDNQYFTTNDSPFFVPPATPVGTWVDVAGASRVVKIPTGATRLVNARFTAETMCTNGDYCPVRIVIYNANGIGLELYPQSGTDFAFDNAVPGSKGSGHAMERDSKTFLPSGTYRVAVQAAKHGAAGQVFRLDDMHLTVDLVRP